MLQDFVVLGANSALPLVDRFSSSFVLRTSNSYFLIDAGEGCQMKLGQFKIKRSKISHIFISHLHGDHVFGLPGLITSFNLNNRQDRLTVYGPKGIQKFIDVVLEISQSTLRFELEVKEISEDSKHEILEQDGIRISAFPLKHRIPTYGYLFEEITSTLNVHPSKIHEYRLTIEEIRSAKEGLDVEREGLRIENEELTYSKREPVSFAYCSDTVYDPELRNYISGVDLMYHEATYLHELHKEANLRQHSTAKEAAQVAKICEAKKLIIGHYSSRYTELSILSKEAKSVFPNTHLAEEGKIFTFS